MTAIFAFVADEFAFVAGDTCRMYRGNVPGQAVKVHAWSDSVVFAQAGEAECLSELILHLKASAGLLGHRDSDLIRGFGNLQPSFWSMASARYLSRNESVPDGSLLVASIKEGGNPARIHELSFATGAVVTSILDIGAGGTDPAHFLNIAKSQMGNLQAHQTPGIPLDVWATNCIKDAVNSFPTIINWPADILITRPSGVGGRLLVQRRVNSGDNSHSIFHVS